MHNKNSELMDVISFNVTPVSHFVKAELLVKFFFFSKKVSAFMCFIEKKIFKHDEQKGIIKGFSGLFG